MSALRLLARQNGAVRRVFLLRAEVLDNHTDGHGPISVVDKCC